MYQHQSIECDKEITNCLLKAQNFRFKISPSSVQWLLIEYSGSSFSFSRLDEYEKLIFAGIAVGILLHPTIYASKTPKLLMREIDDTLHSYKPLCKNICQNLAKSSFLHFSKVIKRDKEISYTTFFLPQKIVLIYSHTHMFFGRGPEF